MEELKILLQKILNKDLQQIILSNSRHPEQTQKVKIRPVLIREELLFQETAYRGTVVPGDCLQRNSGVSREFYSRTADGPDLHRLTGAVPAGRILSEDPAGHRSGQQKGQADTEGEKQWQGTADGGGGCF